MTLQCHPPNRLGRAWEGGDHPPVPTRAASPHVWGLGFVIWGPRFGLWGVGFRVSGFGFRASGFVFRASSFGCGVWGLGLQQVTSHAIHARILDVGFGVWGYAHATAMPATVTFVVWFRVLGFGCVLGLIPGFGLRVSSFGCEVWELGFGVTRTRRRCLPRSFLGFGSGFWALNAFWAWFRVPGLILGFGFRVSDFGFGVWGWGIRARDGDACRGPTHHRCAQTRPHLFRVQGSADTTPSARNNAQSTK